MKEQQVQIEIKSEVRLFSAQVVGVSPISFSKHYDTVTVPKLTDKESHEAYEARTWPNRLHWDKEGQVYVPAMMVKNSIVWAAAYLGLKIPGKGNKTYTKHFESGLLVEEPVMLGVHKDAVKCEGIQSSPDGIKGSPKKVLKYFPVIYDWNGVAKVLMLDDQIPNEVFGRVFAEAGRFCGWGRFRPQKGGYYGRFAIEKLTVSCL